MQSLTNHASFGTLNPELFDVELSDELQKARNYLRILATTPDFVTKMQVAFGNSFDLQKVEELAASWGKGDFGNFPQIEIRDAAEINGARGAFAAATNTIYLSREFVRENEGNGSAIASVLLEEYGHYIDSQINAIDSAGDEGEIFAALAQGKELSESKISALKVENDADTIILDGKTIGIEQSNSNIQVTITAPPATRPNRIGEVTVTYTNVGQTDTAAPLLTLSANGALLQSPNGGFTEERVQFLGINNQGAAGILPPGASGSFKLSFLATGEVGKDINFSASIAQENATIDWNAIKNNARPETVPADAWDVIWNNFTGSVGNTAGQYQAVLAENATRLSQLGEYSNDVSRLLAFELEQAGNYGSIPQRYNIGSLGRGWTFPFEILVTTDSDGNAIVQTSGILRFFTKQPGGGYLSQPGDEATLTQVGDTFQLREQGGTLVAFRPDGKLDFIEDTNSNRVTANYTGNQLTSIISTNGDNLNFSYNTQGRISQIVDRSGRISTYSYNPTGELLLSITDPAGTTSYTYDAGNVLRSVTFPDGTQTLYEYDAQGRVIKQSLNGGAEAITFEYDSAGGVTVVDASGNRTALLLNDLGQIGLAQDILGRTSQFRYNADGNLTQQIAPGNITSTFTYDDRGNLLNQVDPLRNQVNFTYDPTFDQLQSVSDQRGNVTNYNYDEKGNLVAIEYAPKTNQLLSYERGNLTGLINGRTIGRLESIQNTNSTNPVVSYYQKNANLAATNVFYPIESIKEQFNYDLRGNLVKYVNRRGQGIEYAYDDRDRLIEQTNPDGSQINFAYDNRDNLIAATDAKGTITQEFDSADRLTKITYPNGRFLQYSYDAGGRRIRMVDQDGFAVNYSYDAVGRLAGLTDGNGQRIVAYTYDNVGRLSREDNGNGTSTTYGYDAVGQLLNIVNFSPSGEINSRFDYTYDNLGRRTSMTTLEGTFNYGYDANGQLTSVTLPNGRIIQYQYDAAGNRIAVNDNGAVTSYDTNNLNQYTTVGGGNYTYDTDGNLIAKTEGGKSWTYSYDAENRLVSAVTPEGSWSYEYDAFGNRIASTQNGQRTEYLLDPTGLGNVVGEYSNGSLVARYTHGLGLESRVDGTNATAYYDFDVVGSTVGLTAGNGSYVNQYSYLPFGEDLNKVEAVSNPFEFVGQWGVMDEGNGLDFMRARYYDNGNGRFTTTDPIGFLGSGTNLYTYVTNTPLNAIDPKGEFLNVVGGALGGAALSITASYAATKITGQQYTPGKFVNATVSGLITGAVAGGTLNPYATASVGAASGALGYALETAIDKKDFSPIELGVETIASAIPGVGKGISTVGKKFAKDFTEEIAQKIGEKGIKKVATELGEGVLDNLVKDPLKKQSTGFLEQIKQQIKKIKDELYNQLNNQLTDSVFDLIMKILPPPPPSPEDSGTTFNDPRIVTFDKQYHDFQAAGEFTLVQSTSGDLKIQVRQEPVGNNPQSNVSDNTAVTTILGGKRIGIYKGQGLLIDGVRTEIPDLDSLAVGDGRIYREGNIYTIVYATGDQLIAKLQPIRVNINVYLTKEREGQITGLLGNFNNNPKDDLIKRDGTVLNEPVSTSQLYSEYADSWRISQAESLFDYEPGKDTNSFTIKNFPPRKITLSELRESRPADVEKAEKRIGNLIADPTIREATIIDYILTGFDETIIEDAIASLTPNSTLAFVTPTQAVEDFAATTVNTPIRIDVTSNDDRTIGVPISITNFDQTSIAGSIIRLDDNNTPDDKTDDQLIYTPTANFTGNDTFNYTVTDGTQTSTAKVTVNIANFNLSNLNGSNGFTLNGINPGNFAGVSVNTLKDFNGDGFHDFIIGAFAADPNNNNAAGETYVVFGKQGGFPASIDLPKLDGSNGFILNGIDTNGFSGGSVSSAGDINGDGLDDIVIGAFGATANGQNNAGKAYVVFGAKGVYPARANLSDLNGNNGFVVNGINEFDYLGLAVSGAGDINADGIDDLLIGAPGPLNGTVSKSYVIYGHKGTFAANINSSDINRSNGFVINDNDGKSGTSVSAAGDINGDGIDDIIINAEENDSNNYVIFGSANGFAANFNLAELNGSNGFILDTRNEKSGTTVSKAGDINGDTIDDLIISLSSSNSNAGKTYILFGNKQGFAPRFDVSQFNGRNGFALVNNIDGNLISSVSGLGDLNGDGIDDLAISTSQANLNAGKTYILFGDNAGFTSSFSLSKINGTNGLVINGVNEDDLSGTSLSQGGDINGDNIDDLIIGSPGNLFNNSPGQTHVVFGSTLFGSGKDTSNLAKLLFDSRYYITQNPDVRSAVSHGLFHNGFEHFIKFGLTEGRNPSATFAGDYITNNPDVAAAVNAGIFHSGFEHFIKAGLAEGRQPDSIIGYLTALDVFYRSENPDVQAAIQQGILSTGLEHLIRFGMLEGRPPFSRFTALLETFNSDFYLAQNQDVKQAVDAGIIGSGFEHFVNYGLFEGRDPSSQFSNSGYQTNYPDVAAAVSSGIFRSGYEHFIKYGFGEERVGITFS